MADSKVSALTALTTPQPSDELYIVDNSGAPASKKITRQYLLGYIEYVALLTQTGTDAPTATVIKNDTGATVAWTRVIQGLYTGTFSSAILTADKVAVIIVPPSTNRVLCASRSGTSTVAVSTQNAAFALTDALLGNTLIIIRIYV